MSLPLKSRYEKFIELLPRDYSEKYKVHFNIAVDSELYDYAIILLWKTFMLVQYKNIRQSRIVLGDTEFEKNWAQGSLGENKMKLINFNKDSIYSYNKIDDEKVLDLLGRVYDIDHNFVKMLKNLKDRRGTCAHVADDILLATQSQVSNILDELVNISEKISENHNDKVLRSCDIEKISEIKDLSKIDSIVVVDRVVKELAVAPSFKKAEELMKLIIPHEDILSEEKIELILKRSLENTGVYNQVLDASYALEFLSNLLRVAYANQQDLMIWVKFYNKLDDKLKEKFSDIRRSLKQHGAEGIINPNDDEFLDPEDIPF